MDKFLQQRAELVAKARALLDERQKADQALSDDDRNQLKGWAEEVDAVDAKLGAFAKDAPLVAAFSRQTSGPETPGGGKGSQGDGAGNDSDGFDFFSPTASKSLARRLAEKSAKGAGAESEKAFALTDATDVVTTELAPLPHRPTSLLDVLTVVRLNTPTFKFLRQTVRTNNAAPVAAGGTKPTTVLGLVPVEASLKVLAHLSDPLDKYLLRDVGNLTQFVQNELSFGLYEALERQVVSGTGVAPQLLGLDSVSGVLTQAFATDTLTTVRKSLTKLETLGYVPRAVVLRPEDWETVELSQTSGSGEYLFAQSPVDRAAQKLWGVQVVLSTAPAAGKGYVFGQDAVKLYTDGRVDAEWDTSTGFDKNQVRLRVESRYEVGVSQPQGVVKFDTVE